jgi:acetyl esterase/lipase
MKRFGIVVLLVSAVFLPAARADEGAKPKIKTGGSYDVETVKGVAYFEGKDADPVRHKLDLYLPKGRQDFPVLFFVHGGAWRFGSKDTYAPLGRTFAKNGVGVVVTNYRLSPKVMHPAHIEDVAKAFGWTHRNIGKYGGRADQLFVSGHSAGGHLVALLCTDASHLAREKLAVSNVKGMIPMSGVYTIPAGMLKEAFGTDEKVCKAASPLTHVKGDHPPALIIYADKDYPFLDVMGEEFCKKLKGCRCEASSLKVGNRTHITIIVQVASETDPATQAMLEFIARHSGLKLTERQEKAAN